MQSLFSTIVNAVNLNSTNSTMANLVITNSTNVNLSVATGTMSNLNITNSLTSVQPFIIVFANSNQSVLQGTSTVVTFWGGASTASGISQASGVFTVTSAGLYYVSTFIPFSNNTTNDRVIWFVKNNVTTDVARLGNVYYSASGSTEQTCVVTSAIVPMAAADNIRVYVYQNSGGTLSMDATFGPKFEMIKLNN